GQLRRCLMDARSLLALMALAGPLAAQQPAHPMHTMMDDPMAMQEMMGPMMQVMLYTPQHLLARKDALGLTTDQVGRLTTLRGATHQHAARLVQRPLQHVHLIGLHQVLG